MRLEQVSFHNAGSRLAGTLLFPDTFVGAAPGIVQGPGWLGLRDAQLYLPYHEALTAAGFVVMTLDYRGFGDSEGDATFLDPMDQVSDIRAALTYLQTRAEVDPRRLGVFGSGGTGGGNAVMAAGLDERVLATVAQVPVSDGRDWLHRMRREHEWLEFLDSVRAARQRYVSSGELVLVPPREGIMVPTPERRTTTVKSDVDGRVPDQVALIAADAIMAYRPVEVVERIAPRALMLISVEHDAVTPEDHARAMYDRATGPRRLVIQTGTTHYAAYAHYRDVVNPLIVDWFRRYLVTGEVIVHEDATAPGITYLDRPTQPAAAIAGGAQ